MDSPPPHVPDELMQQLHDATERFHQHKKNLEAKQNEAEYSHQEHVDRASDELKAAERELEEINRKISDAMKK